MVMKGNAKGNTKGNMKGSRTAKRPWLDDVSLRATVLLVLVIFVLLAAVAVAFYFRQNEEKAKLVAEGQVLQAELAALQQESDSLNQLEVMSGQPQYIERIARDELGMIGADEKVFKDVE